MCLLPLTPPPFPPKAGMVPHLCVQIACHTWVPSWFSEGSWGDISPAGHTVRPQSESLPPLRASLSSPLQFPVELAYLRTFILIMISRPRPAWLSDLLSPGDSSQEADHSSCLPSLTEGRYLPPSHGQPWCWLLAGPVVSSLWASPPEHPTWLPRTCPDALWEGYWDS